MMMKLSLLLFFLLFFFFFFFLIPIPCSLSLSLNLIAISQNDEYLKVHTSGDVLIDVIFMNYNGKEEAKNI